MEKKISGRGGAREGAGRKAKFVGETKVIRVPVEALPKIEKILKKFLNS